MKTASADLALPTAVPFFHGWWSDAAVAAGAWTNLPIIANSWRQKGMQISGGGCKVPIRGLYHIGLFCRSDCSGSGATFTEMQILLNGGGSVGTTLQDNGYVGGQLYPYAYQQLWTPYVLNANDVLTVQAYTNALGVTFFGAGWAGSGLRVLYAGPPTGVQ